MPLEIVYGFAYLKKAAAHANHDLGVLPLQKKNLISQVCDEILAGDHDDQFPWLFGKLEVEPSRI